MAKGHSNADNSTMAQTAENLETNALVHWAIAVAQLPQAKSNSPFFLR